MENCVWLQHSWHKNINIMTLSGCNLYFYEKRGKGRGRKQKYACKRDIYNESRETQPEQ